MDVKVKINVLPLAILKTRNDKDTGRYVLSRGTAFAPVC
jgi:hypothetical protein